MGLYSLILQAVSKVRFIKKIIQIDYYDYDANVDKSNGCYSTLLYAL